MIDLAVVGAGAAGLAAARRARALGLSALVLEAKARVGGRAWTVATRAGEAVDLGAHWIHSASLNPFVALAAEHGFRLVPHGGIRRVWLSHAGRWASAAELAERSAFYIRTEAAIVAAGEAGRDGAVADLIPDEAPWGALFAQWTAAYTGVDPDAASTGDWARYRDTHENLGVEDGYGALVARLAEGVPVRLAAPVAAIGWNGAGVRLATAAGTLEARAAVVTVSNGVLEADAIRFDPALPDWKRTAIDGVPLGRANRVVLTFDRPVFGRDPGFGVAVARASAETVLLQIRPFGRDMAVGYVGGRHSDALERAGPDALVAFVRERLREAFGAKIDRHVGATLASRWGSDPDVRGAYSAALPGMAHRRTDLARPVGGRLFFAGEATHPAFFSTVHGAYLSGIRAAEEAAASIGA